LPEIPVIKIFFALTGFVHVTGSRFRGGLLQNVL
jgi:hypothetical protein